MGELQRRGGLKGIKLIPASAANTTCVQKCNPNNKGFSGTPENGSLLLKEKHFIYCSGRAFWKKYVLFKKRISKTHRV